MGKEKETAPVTFEAFTIPRGAGGITLLELMMALAAGAVLVAAVYTVYIAQARGRMAQGVSLELQQGQRAALLTMKQEIRTAGMDPTGKAGARIITAEPGAFRFTRDVTDKNGYGRFDGKISGPNEDIRYAVNSAGNLGRDTCRPASGGQMNCSGLQSILNHVDALEFVYLDEKGAIIGHADLQSQAGRNRIRQVVVTLIARSGYAGRGLPPGYRDNRTYKNPFGDPLPDQPYCELSRRLKISTAIALRNPPPDPLP